MRFLPKSSLARRAESFGALRIAHWLHSRQSTVLFSHHDRFVRLCDRLQREAATLQVKLFGDFGFHEYASNVVELTAEGYGDPWFQNQIKSHKDTAFLYTNGGIVPEDLLAEPGLKIIHVHPGVVPQFRGSDALIWSYLLTGRIGASCFFMSPGIDEGRLLKAANFSVPSLTPLQDYLGAVDEDLAYRALLFAVDPHMRAQLLCKVLSEFKGDDLREISSTKQPKTNWAPFLWMHPKLRSVALNSLSSARSADKKMTLISVVS
ncbi:hypothetical protein TH8_08520 [Thalassospira profundimaris]|nr:hypothetical protein TH8_08520 [Thalassospira profundimaris]